MTAAFIFGFLAGTFFVGPFVGAAADRHRRRVRNTEYVRIAPKPTQAPHWTRDPSPRPRRIAS